MAIITITGVIVKEREDEESCNYLGLHLFSIFDF